MGLTDSAYYWKVKFAWQRVKIMAKRSTRNKIQYHARKLDEHLDRMIADVAAMADLADGNSAYLNDACPMMITSIEEFRAMVAHFFKGL